MQLTVRPAPGQSSRGIVRLGPLVFPCALGRSGIGILKREGDGCTPRASMRILYGFLRRGGIHALRAKLPLRPIDARDGWCDQPGDRNYNRRVRLPYPSSHERMLREDGLYDICIVLDWNISSRSQGRGSAIFLHLARPGYQPTEGCIALSRRDMTRLLPYLAPGMRVVVTG